MSVDADLPRLQHGAEELVRVINDMHDDGDVRIDNFLIVAIVVDKDEDGNEIEAPVMWSDSKRAHVRAGILTSALIDYADESAAQDDGE